MQETSLGEIKAKALQFHNNSLRWHFHILTPKCKFNKKPHYAFVLEGPDATQRFVHYSKQVPNALGKKLAPLAHKAKVLSQETTEVGYEPSEIVRKIISRARKLNQEKIEWHHHVTFPGCQFNTNSSKFTFIFEDPESGETLESSSDKEPINDLKQIEPLFYSQKR